jgi:SAM-dependent methyltransferase
MDWGTGHFENLAAQLRPAAEVVIGQLAPRPGETVLDLGCGTGNAALIAARRGARVTGVDPSPRLLGLAREAAAGAGLTADFALGDAARLPVPDGSMDAIAAVFALIFASDPAAAAAEMSRVLRPGGRVALSAWLPVGGLAGQVRLRYELITAAGGEVPGSEPFAWHDRGALEELLAPHGFTVTASEHALPFTGTSPAAYADGQLANHPGWVQARALLEPAGLWKQARARLAGQFAAANEDPAAFRVTARYVVATAARRH